MAGSISNAIALIIDHQKEADVVWSDIERRMATTVSLSHESFISLTPFFIRNKQGEVCCRRLSMHLINAH